VTAIDPGDLRDMIRDCAIDLWQRGVTDPARFVHAFNERYGNVLSIEQRQYGFEQWLVAAGNKMMKKVRKEILKQTGSLQFDLPMDLQKYDIPDTLTIPRGWVPLHEADEADLDAQLAEMLDHVDDCLNKIVGFRTFVERVRPILRDNPGWKTGDALRWLKVQERGAA
jgi:hypothetical protein